ncbi:MAG: NAD+ synthase [Deltaproteobacteria bacterium]|nr:NAD+ synthase [Deltaproteobacteria bacterium]
MDFIRIAQAQLNATVGDFTVNIKKIIDFIDRASSQQADIVTFPELAVCGYPPEDLLLKPRFLQDNLKAIEQIKQHAEDITVVVGFADSSEKTLYSAAGILQDHNLLASYYKTELPNYGVFDEKRYFSKGSRCIILKIRQIALTVNICEDIWIKGGVPYKFAVSNPIDIALNLSASPFHVGKFKTRVEIASRFARSANTWVCFNNLAGGQDELVFDGGSFVMNPQGKIISQAERFQEDLLISDIYIDTKKRISNGIKPSELCPDIICLKSSPEHNKPKLISRSPKQYGQIDEIYQALVLGTRDYVRKNGFRKTVIGLSGGIDSTLTAVIAADALGADNVVGVTMPSQYTSNETFSDATLLANNLKLKLITIPLENIYKSYIDTFKDIFEGEVHGVVHENIQARIRGNILMALSNQFGWLVLTTGNKSEVSVGYCTLYGDMAGGFAVIKDVPKTLVFELSGHINRIWSRDLIPLTVLERPPSAELRPDQKDEDSLPPYPVLDSILQAYVVEDKALDEIINSGHDPDIVKKIIRMVDLNEYKRRQAPPGVKITPKAFGRDRRLPITNCHWKSTTPSA